VLFFLLAALRGARRVDEQHDAELIDSLERRRDALAARSEPLPPLRQRETGADPLPSLTESEQTKPPA
jgi:hypothetical protein